MNSIILLTLVLLSLLYLNNDDDIESDKTYQGFFG